MFKILEAIPKIISWIQIFISPSLIGIIIGGLVYLKLDNNLGFIIGLIIVLIGILFGIRFAEKARNGKGTVWFMSRIMATPELDNSKYINQNKNKHIDLTTDWRYQGQEKYLSDLFFLKSVYISKLDNEHDHCEFCNDKFSNIIPEALKKGWTDDSKYRWICDNCFSDFEHELDLKRK